MSKKNPNRPNDIMKHELMRNALYREKREKSTAEKEERKNPYSKTAKHKGERPQSLEEFYHVGDKVDIISGSLKKVLDKANALHKKKSGKEGDDIKAIVKEPMGPSGSLGITIDGVYHLIDEDDIELLYEACDLREWSYADMTSGIRVPVSNEEQDILTLCSNKFYKSNMDERQQEVARRMVSRGVLHRGKDQEGIFFNLNSKKITRF